VRSSVDKVFSNVVITAIEHWGDALSEGYPTIHTARPVATDEWLYGLWQLASPDTPQSGAVSTLSGSTAGPQLGLSCVEGLQGLLATLAGCDLPLNSIRFTMGVLT